MDGWINWFLSDIDQSCVWRLWSLQEKVCMVSISRRTQSTVTTSGLQTSSVVWGSFNIPTEIRRIRFSDFLERIRNTGFSPIQQINTFKVFFFFSWWQRQSWRSLTFDFFHKQHICSIIPELRTKRKSVSFQWHCTEGSHSDTSVELSVNSEAETSLKQLNRQHCGISWTKILHCKFTVISRWAGFTSPWISPGCYFPGSKTVHLKVVTAHH